MNTTKIFQTGLLCGMLGIAGGLGACERRVVETTKTEQGPNGSKVEKKTVIQHNDGTVTEEKTTEKTVNP